MSLISLLLHEWTFGAALISTGTFILLKQRHLHASLAILFFIGGWYATEIPLLYAETPLSTADKYVAQGIISLCLIALYGTFSDITALVLVACINELILISVNIVFLIAPFHSWHHWFIFGVVNWISFVLLVLNWRNYDKRYISQRVFREFNVVKARGNLHTSSGHNLQKNQDVAREEACWRKV